MKRFALNIIMVGSLVLAGVLPALAAGPELLSELVQLADSKLDDIDLAAVSGRGALHKAAPVETGKVIIWDEGPQAGVVSHDISTGYGTTQSSTVSVNGR